MNNKEKIEELAKIRRKAIANCRCSCADINTEIDEVFTKMTSIIEEEEKNVDDELEKVKIELERLMNKHNVSEAFRNDFFCLWTCIVNGTERIHYGRP